MSEVLDVVTDDAIKLAVATAHAQEGYALNEGGIDNQARIEAGFQAISNAIVDDPSERAARAVARADLISQVFPHLPSPEKWAEQQNPELAEKVYKRLSSLVWQDAKPDKTGKIQQMVGQANGLPEMVLCRTEVGKHRIEAVYLTRNLRCMLLDNSATMKKALKRQAENYAANLAMWVARVPEHAEALEKDYRSGMKVALNAGQATMTLALEENTGTRNNDQEEPGGS